MSVLYLILGLLMGLITFVWLYPPLGGRHSADERAGFAERSSHVEKGRFQNVLTTSMQMGGRETVKVLWSFLVGSADRKPKKPLPMERFVPAEVARRPGVQAVWLGHSALFLAWHGKTILIDPMFGKAPTPFPWLAGQRYSGGLPFDWEHLPPVDVVFFSHDHYDHLDYGTVRRLRGRVRQFFVPLGVGAHLVRWGVDPDRITELAWWEEREWEGLALACTPARHFSGRRLVDRDRTLWCSWVIGDQQTRLFYSGDSGYGPHFKEIGQKYGPFQLSFMECGQYDLRWKEIHMLPEETVQAAFDVRTERCLPIHWAAFTLALHDWYEPAERVVAEAERVGVQVVTPKIGEVVDVADGGRVFGRWWRAGV